MSAKPTRSKLVTGKRRAAMYGRNDFLRDFGHGAYYHQRFTLKTATPEDGAITNHRMSAAGLAYSSDTCGWWFCQADAGGVDWPQLRAALHILRRAGVDPHGLQVARIGSERSRVSGWADERAGYETLYDGLRNLRSSLSKRSDAECLRRKWIAELRPLLKNATDAAPPVDHRPAAEPLRAAIALARSWGWKPATLAAAMVLNGSEKADFDFNFKAFKKRMADAFRRCPADFE